MVGGGVVSEKKEIGRVWQGWRTMRIDRTREGKGKQKHGKNHKLGIYNAQICDTHYFILFFDTSAWPWGGGLQT